jgi:hypothetical protein
VAIHPNQEAVEHAQNLIKGRQYEGETSGGYIAAPSSPPSSAPVPKTTTMSKAPPPGCLSCCLAKTTSRS